MLAGAWAWFFYPTWKVAGGLSALAGAVALVAAAVVATRARKTTRLSNEPYPRGERVVAAVSAAAALAIAATGARGLGMDYNPFAGLETPGFATAGAAVALACAWPVAALVRRGPHGRAPTLAEKRAET
jgi:hypothetical protein